MSYAKSPRGYRYEMPPMNAASSQPYMERQLVNIQNALQTHSDAISEIQTGTSTGSSINLGATGVKPGRYTNPSMTVAADGRITVITDGESQAIPAAPSSGLFLASSGNGFKWVSAPVATSTGGSASGGSSGGGSSAATRSVRGSSDINVAVTPSAYSLSLLPTAVFPGTYQNATVTVDQNGRITSAAPGTDWTATIHALQQQVAALTAVLHSQVPADAITGEDSITTITTEDGSDYISF